CSRDEQRTIYISESFLTVKGAALFLPRGKSPTPNSAPRISQRKNKHTGDLQKHLQTMFTVLRPEDTIRLAVRLESAHPQTTRYMVVVSTNGRQDTEESIVLGMDFVSSDSCCTVGLVLPLWSDTLIHLDGDGGFSVSTVNRVHVFKPVSVQAMWSALQSLHKACEVARCHNYYPGSLFLTWVSYYQSRISSNQFCINEWNAMQDVESHRANSPVLFTDLPTERERTERLIKMRLREIMMQKDLENVTSKEIRTELEMQMVCNLREFKEFIDNEMIVILGQMDSPTEIFEHVYLGSEWNASNLEELQNSGVRYILNVTREIDNFFPGMFEYHNIRVYDEEATNLLEYWNDTYKFITKAKKAGAKCLVHCKMGVSRSASTVIAYAMKEYGWDLDTAFDYVKERRAVTKPNPSFMKQLEEYQGILLASKQRHNKLWRSHSDSDLSGRPEAVCKTSSQSLGCSDSHNNNTTSSPSFHHFLGVAILQALDAEPKAKSNAAPTADSHTHSNGVSDSSVQEEVRSDCADPLLQPLPKLHTATVVPEERLNNAVSVAVTVPVAVPHPPPLLHILPPTPELQLIILLPKPKSFNSPSLFLFIPQASLPCEDSLDKGSPDYHDNGLSVRHIVTEIEAICHPATGLPSPLSSSSSSLSPSSHSPQFIGPENQEETEPSDVQGSLTPPSHPQSPSTLPCDWPAGSVRRATEQLEQKLKQEMDMAASPRSPVHSPSTEHPPVRLSLCSTSTEHPLLHSPLQSIEQSIAQGEITTLHSQNHSQSRPGSCGHGCEAQNRLAQVSSGQTSPDLEVGWRLQEGKSLLESTGWHKSTELEARIRQAGLTPPSLMKRSASLAKLDSLELSASDLSDWDLRPHTRTLSSHSQDCFSLTPAHSDDTWKKQKVLTQNSCVEKTGVSHDDSSSPPSLCLSSSPRHGPKERTGEREEPDGSSMVTTSRQQGRGHSSRRSRKSSAEKKQRAITVLYNTM
uniref:protein-serine/threonine phosphatase n=1 Tax=Mastacembelus armatus TaxID=205130 RepID=A0A7N8XV53_9TELE